MLIFRVYKFMFDRFKNLLHDNHFNHIISYKCMLNVIFHILCFGYDKRKLLWGT